MFSNDLATHLFNEDIGLSSGVNLFEGRMPTTPITCVTILETGGIEPDKYVPFKSPTFQVLIRSTDYPTGKALLNNVRSAFHGLANQTVGNTFFQWVWAISEGGHIGQDDAGNELFSINFQCRTR